MAILTLNDDDPSIAYTGPWEKGGSMGMGDSTNGSTTYVSAGDVDTFATVTFTGSGIMVLGTINEGEQPSSSYTIRTLEGNKTTTFKLLDIAEQYFYNYTFFQSGPLSPTSQHTLVITPILGTLLIDILEIRQDTPFSSQSLSSSSSTLQFSTPKFSFSSLSLPSSTSTQETSPLSSSSSLSSSSPSSSSTQQSCSPASTAGTVTPVQGRSDALIGPICGAFAALTFIYIFLLLHLRRRWRRTHSHEQNGARSRSERAKQYFQPHPTPYDISQPSQHDREGQPRLAGTEMTPETITSAFPSGQPPLPMTSYHWAI